MPTQSTTYNARLTDETLEKRFRDTFRSQGGAELVDDLYASGVIVPVVDFTAAAEGSVLRADLQAAYSTSTDAFVTASTGTQTIISNAGFYSVKGVLTVDQGDSVGNQDIGLGINDGTSFTKVWNFRQLSSGAPVETFLIDEFVVFLDSGNTFEVRIATNLLTPFSLNVITNNLADIQGNLTNPSGFQIT